MEIYITISDDDSDKKEFGAMKDVLSVIIPVYNVKQYIGRCLESIINQTYQNVEIICINDGSTDGSDEVLAAYAHKDSRIKIFNQSNSGVSNARNLGMAKATGRYITFVDSDDYINPETYGLCMPLFRLDIDVVIFSANIIVENTEVQWGGEGYFQVREQNLMAVTPAILKKENVSVWNKVYKTEIIKQNQIQFPADLWYEDNEFYWKYMSFVRNAYFLRNKLYNYTRRSGSIMYSTFSNSEKLADHFTIYEHLLAFWLDNLPLNHFIEDIGAEIFRKFFYFTYIHSAPANKKQIIKKAVALIEKHKLVELFPHDVFIKDLANKQQHRYVWIDEYSFWQKLFSIKKFKYDKNIYFCGCRIRLKRTKYKNIH